MTGPKRAVVVLLDSLNRHHVGAYGSDEFATPNLDRLAARSVRFDRHYAGSLPCMPARHDLLLGALDFLWRLARRPVRPLGAHLTRPDRGLAAELAVVTGGRRTGAPRR